MSDESGDDESEPTSRRVTREQFELLLREIQDGAIKQDLEVRFEVGEAKREGLRKPRNVDARINEAMDVWLAADAARAVLVWRARDDDDQLAPLLGLPRYEA